MKRRCSRFLAGLLAAVMVVSSGGLEVAASRRRKESGYRL